MEVTTPVVPKKRMGRSAKQVTPTSQGPELEQSHPSNHEGGSKLMDIFPGVSSRLYAIEVYIASQQQTERVNCMRGATQLTSAEGSRSYSADQC